MVFLAGAGVEGRGVEVAWHAATNAGRFVTPTELRETVERNPQTTFTIVIDASYAGQFVGSLPASLANLLVLSVSCSAAQLAYGGAVTTIRTGSALERNPDPSPGAPSGFVANFIAGWRAFASSRPTSPPRRPRAGRCSLTWSRRARRSAAASTGRPRSARRRR